MISHGNSAIYQPTRRNQLDEILLCSCDLILAWYRARLVKGWMFPGWYPTCTLAVWTRASSGSGVLLQRKFQDPRVRLRFRSFLLTNCWQDNSFIENSQHHGTYDNVFIILLDEEKITSCEKLALSESLWPYNCPRNIWWPWKSVIAIVWRFISYISNETPLI